MTARALIVATVLALGTGYVGGRLAGESAGAAAEAHEIDELERRVAALDVARPAPPPERRHAPDEIAADDDRRLAALADRVVELKKTTAGPTSAEQAAATDVRRLGKLDAAKLLEEIDARLDRFLSPRANDPLKERDAEATVRACDVLLARELKPTDRATGLLQKGRALGVLNSRDAEEAAFRDAIAAVGAASPIGHIAQAQLGWTALRCKEPRVAAERFLVVAAQPDAAPRERAMYQLFAANGLVTAGDVARARELYRAVGVEFGTSDDTYARRFADNARDALTKLDQDGGGR